MHAPCVRETEEVSVFMIAEARILNLEFWFISQAINLLPANTQIREIRVFLESVLEENAKKKRFNQVLKSLLQAEFLRVTSQLCDQRA